MKQSQIVVAQVALTDGLQYRVTKTVDTTAVKIGEMLSPESIDRYCYDRKYRVTINGQR